MPNTMRLFYFTSDHWGKENIEKRRLKLSFPSFVNDVFELRPFDFGKGEDGRLLRNAWSKAIDKHSMSQGFISFVENWAVPTMWGHYAANHRGVCLGFDLPVQRADGKKYADKIEYVSELYPMNARVLSDINYNEQMVNIARKTKSAHWSYEQEWRYWFSLSDEEMKLKKEFPENLFFVNFDSTLVLREVIIGYKSVHTTESLKALLHPGDNVNFTTARPSFRRFAMVPQRYPGLIK